jgi:hypothetical protein
MTDHLIFPLESFTSYAARTTGNGTEMWSILRVNIGMRAVDKISGWPKHKAKSERERQLTLVDIVSEKRQRYSLDTDICTYWYPRLTHPDVPRRLAAP